MGTVTKARKELLHLVGASVANLSLPKLTGGGFWHRLYQKQKLKAILAANLVPKKRD